MPSIPLWSVVPHSTSAVPTLSRTFTCKNFVTAMSCMTTMGKIFERQSHHADLSVHSYRNVTVTIYTHSVDGVTLNDVELAKVLDQEVKIEYSPKWLKENALAMGTAVVKGSKPPVEYCLNVTLYCLPTRRDEFLACIAGNCAGTLNTEPLAISYEWGESETSENTFHFHERYQGREGFEAHTQTEHFKAWEQFAATEPFSKDPEVLFFTKA